jgi:hypothetical protein
MPLDLFLLWEKSVEGSDIFIINHFQKPALAFNNTIRLGCVHPMVNEVWACILTPSTTALCKPFHHYRPINPGKLKLVKEM